MIGYSLVSPLLAFFEKEMPLYRVTMTERIADKKLKRKQNHMKRVVFGLCYWFKLEQKQAEEGKNWDISTPLPYPSKRIFPI